MGTAITALDDERTRRLDGDGHDDVLVGRAARGDEGAWEHIVTRYTAYLRSIGRAYRLSSEEIADAVQETWLRAVTNLADLRDPARFRPWLATIMRRRCTDVLQRRRTDREMLVGGFGDVGDVTGPSQRDERLDVEYEVMVAERAAILHSALRLLPERERELLHQLASDDPSYEEITRRLSMPVGSIGPTRMRALRRLRLILEQNQAGDLLLAS
jgi:RNA polymerase sigma factor (sigma-70 family)